MKIAAQTFGAAKVFKDISYSHRM